MKIFERLNALRTYQRKHRPYLESLEDLDLVCAIGCAQELERPISPSDLVDMQLGSTPTVRRRLARLINQQIVVRRADAEDGRRVLLHLSAKVFKTYAKLDTLC